MNRLGIWAIAIAGAFVIGILSANPVVEAVGGWKAAVDGLDTRITTLENQQPTELYTKTQNLVLADNSVKQIVTQKCDVGDTVVNGYLKHFTSETVPKIDVNQFTSGAFNVGGTDGWIIEWFPSAPNSEVFDFVIVCAEGVLPQN